MSVLVPRSGVCVICDMAERDSWEGTGTTIWVQHRIDNTWAHGGGRVYKVSYHRRQGKTTRSRSIDGQYLRVVYCLNLCISDIFE